MVVLCWLCNVILEDCGCIVLVRYCEGLYLYIVLVNVIVICSYLRIRTTIRKCSFYCSSLSDHKAHPSLHVASLPK